MLAERLICPKVTEQSFATHPEKLLPHGDSGELRSCSKVVELLLPDCGCLSPALAQPRPLVVHSGHLLPDLGQIWPHLAESGQMSSHRRNFGPNRSMFVEVWPKLAQLWGELGSTLGSQGQLLTTFEQLIGICWTSSELVGIGGSSHFSGREVSKRFV